MKSAILILFLVTILCHCHESKKVEEINNENDVIKSKKVQGKKINEKKNFSVDYEKIKNICSNTNTYTTFSDTFPQIKPISKDFIESLNISELKLEEEIDGLHKFNYFVLNSKLNGSFFYFTLLSKSPTIEISRLYLFVIDRESGKIKDWAKIAEQYNYEGLIKDFKIKCLQNLIEIEYYESVHNKDGKLHTTVKIENFRINEEQKITNKRINKRSFIGKEKAIFLEYDHLFKITIPNMYCSECNLSEFNPMYRSKRELSTEDTSSFELAEVWGISGNIADNKIIFDYNKDNFEINSIKLAAASGIFFNQEGTGGVWQEGGSTLSDWMQLTINDSSECKIPDTESLIESTQIPNEQINKAKKKQQANSQLCFNIYLAYMIIEIEYNAFSKPYKKYIEFVLGYGD